MSLIRRFLNIWASSGSLESPVPDADKIDTGFVGDERPYIERFNWLQNRLEKKFNDLATQIASSAYDEATEATVQAMIETGLWGDSWACTDDAANLIEGGATMQYRDVTAYFNADGDARLLVADTSTMKIEIWDPRLLTQEDISHDLCDDLPVGVVAATSDFQCLCSDGMWVYAVVKDTAPAPDEYYIQAWLISDWSVKTAWPATGTQLTPTGTGKLFKAIIASAATIAVINNATTITAAGDPVIEIIDIDDGVILADGAGDAPTAITAIADPVIASDGTNLFFGAYGSTNLLYPCSATIADPTTGCGGTDWGVATNYDAHIGAMVSMDEKIVSFLNWGSQAYSNEVILTHTAVDAIRDIILLGQDAQAAPLTSDEYLYRECTDAVFDGVNIWVFVDIDNLSAGISGGFMKIDAAKLSFNIIVDQYRCIDDLEPSLFMVMPKDAISLGEPQMGITFDGRDIWGITQQAGSSTNSGKIARLPLALIRG